MNSFSDELDWALESANLPTLVMVLFHLTGDLEWLDAPYRPSRPIGLDDNDSGGFAPEVAQTIRENAAAAVLNWRAEGKPARPLLSLELAEQMMSSCVGRQVPLEYVQMMAEEMGLVSTSPDGSQLTRADGSDRPFVAVIGAGMSGILAAVKLKQAGFDFTVIEKNAEVGGTWFENTYPGAGVDTPSYLYSYSFFPHDWDRHFSQRDDVFNYLNRVVDHFELRESIRFGSEVESAAYDDQTAKWHLTVNTRAGTELVVANAVISAVGLLNRPNVPNIPGMDDFSGEMFHSARWPRGLDVSDKRVALVGTGASAMQIAPRIADSVESLSIFQRSPQWAAPCTNYFRAVSPQHHWLTSNVPHYRDWYRFRLGWTFSDSIHPSLQLDKSWQHAERSVNSTNDRYRRYFTEYIERELSGHDYLLEKCIPTYPPYGKRILLDNGWYAALTKSNVELIDQPVASFDADRVICTDGRDVPVDVVILCTGFQAQRPLYPMEIVGPEGSIREVWNDDDARAYLGISSPGFPNLFFMYGPNTNPAGGSIITIAECQIHYIVEMLDLMVRHDLRSVECREAVNERFNHSLDQANANMVWSHPGMNNYFKNTTGRIVTNWPWSVAHYWHSTRSPNLEDFNVVENPRIRRTNNGQEIT